MPDSVQLRPEQKVGGGRFRLIRPLGRGGMGEVWLAQDERLAEPVALKFLPPEVRTDPVALDDLRRETARSHRLTHLNIVRIHDLHEEAGGLAFIAMEFVDGPTLAALRLQQPERVFTWEFLKPLVQQLCVALEYAHGERVIHRDLKPANMMLDSRSRLKLADFGIAAMVSDSVSRISLRHSTSGTLAYMSPQQLAGKRPQVSDDIYALGATLYELLTSKPPFYTGDITHQVLHEMPEPVGERLAALEIQNDIPSDVAALVMACLAKEPAQRPQSAAAVAGWVGLETVKQPAREDLAGTMFPETQSEGADAAAESVRVAEPASRVGGSKRVLVPIAVATAVLLGGIGVWQIAKRRSGSNQPWQSVTRGDSPASGQSARVDGAGFVSLFNGRDLSGWDGDSKVWSVKDGAIIAHIIGAEKPTNYFLIRRDLTITDFELRALCRFIGGSPGRPYPGNLAVAYRGKDLGDWFLNGYQFDLQSDAFPGGNGAIVEMHPKGRKTLAKGGQKTVAWPGGGADEFQVVGTACAKEEVDAAIKKDDWNELIIVARSNRITHQLNGLVTSELTDNNEAKRALSGLVALKAYFYRGPEVIAQFKDIRLKRLATASSETPAVEVAKEPGFVSLFNGRDLTGWEGDKTYWSMKDGAIVGRVEGEWRTNHQLVCAAGEVEDFELRFAFWQPPNQGPADGAPGVCFRAAQPADMRCYVLDIHNLTNNHAELRDAGGRSLIGPAGKQVIAPAGAASSVRVAGEIAKPAELEASYKYGGWNDITIIAVTNRVRAWINGQLQFDCTDEDEARRYRAGSLALKLFSNRARAVTAKFKDIRLKRIAPGTAARPLPPVGGTVATPRGLPVQMLPAQNLDRFYVFIKDRGTNADPNKVFTLIDGVLRISGEEQGYLATKADYSSYQLVAEYKWGSLPAGQTERDSGVFVHGHGPDRFFMASIECSLYSGSNWVSGLVGRVAPRTHKDQEMPIGQWNTLELLCDGGRVQAKLNGHAVTEITNAVPKSGKILLQSRWGEVFFRRLELQPIN